MIVLDLITEDKLPKVKWYNDDKAVLTCTDGSQHELSFTDKMFLRSKIVDIQSLEYKYSK